MKGAVVSAMRTPALRGASWLYGRLRIGPRPRPGLRILTYHALGTPIEGNARSIYNMPPERFEQHSRHLACRYAGRLSPLGTRIPEDEVLRIAVTFDDGYRDNLSIAAPILVEAGIPFSIFVCTGKVAKRTPGFLAPGDLRELGSLPGAMIGSHTVDHPRLTECDDSRLRRELVDSKTYLEDLLGREVDSLSYPHGAVDRRVRDMAESAGYRIGASSRFDINHAGRDPLLLCRTDIWAEDRLDIFEQKLRGDWDWNRWRRADPGAGPSHSGILGRTDQRGHN